MKSYQIVEWGQPLRLLERETPVPSGAEVLVRVRACGICHSDVHIGDGHFDLGEGRRIALGDLGATLPFTMGHEIVGVVAAVGPDATASVGMPCVVYPWIGCGQCAQCAHGLELNCGAMRSLGTRQAGGYSDHVLVPHSRYLVAYGDLDPHFAATCACSGLTAYSALKKLPDCTASDTVVLIGAGGLGLAALGLVRHLTPARIVVADIDPAKLELARKLGADGILNTSDPDAVASLRSMSGGAPSALVDFVGSAGTVDFAMKVVAKGGTVIVVGLFGGSLSVSTVLLPIRNLTLRGSYVGTLAEMEALLSLIRAQRIEPLPLSLRSMEDVNEALSDLREGRVEGRIVAVL
jgi:D-arabinose 1-dehydrogenase-like Zn-dependent alcohol dehydrogenase